MKYKDFYSELVIENVLTGTDAFKKWFGDSKVVDKDGNPLVVFHGTQTTFSEFDPNRIGSRFGYDKSGFFFTSDRREARGLSFSDEDKNSIERRFNADIRKSADDRVILAYLSIKSPLTKRDIIRSSEYVRETYYSATDFYDTNRKLIESLLSSDKFDGVILENVAGENLYVALKPTQIKSATGNNGKFDPNNKNIFLEFNIRQKGSCMLYAEKVNTALIKKGISNYEVVEGYVRFKKGHTYTPTFQHTWIEFNDGRKIDKTKEQFNEFDISTIQYIKRNAKIYSPKEYSDLCRKHPVDSTGKSI